MTLLLPALRDYLKEVFQPAGGPKRVQQIRVAPEAWIRKNLNNAAVPAIFLWGDSDQLTPGQWNNSATESMRVALQVITQSEDPDAAAFNASLGLFPLKDEVVEALARNKKLSPGPAPYSEGNPTQAANGGLWLPIDTQYFQLPYAGGFYAVGAAMRIEYRRRMVPWNGAENNDN